MDSFTSAIRCVVDFARDLPGFQLLSHEDQVTLLKAGTFEVMLVQLSCLFDAKSNTMLFVKGKIFCRTSASVRHNHCLQEKMWCGFCSAIKWRHCRNFWCDDTNRALLSVSHGLYCGVQPNVAGGFLLNSVFDFAERFNELQLNDTEMALFSALIILSAGKKTVNII
jgi:nuclear receptor subfamily 1 group D protein 3